MHGKAIIKVEQKLKRPQNEGFSKPNPNIFLESYLFFLNLAIRKSKSK